MQIDRKLSVLPLLIWNTALMVRDDIDRILLVCSTSRRYNKYLRVETLLQSEISSLCIISVAESLVLLFKSNVRLNVCCYRLQLWEWTPIIPTLYFPSTHFYRNLLRCMGTSPGFHAVLSKGDNICDFLFASLDNKVLLK